MGLPSKANKRLFAATTPISFRVRIVADPKCGITTANKRMCEKITSYKITLFFIGYMLYGIGLNKFQQNNREN